MIRVLVLGGIVVMVHFALGALIGWLTHRPRPNWVYVACVVNAVLLASVLLTIDRFRADGLTLYNVFFAGLMLWVAATAARLGTFSIQTIRREAP